MLNTHLLSPAGERIEVRGVPVYLPSFPYQVRTGLTLSLAGEGASVKQLIFLRDKISDLYM